MSFYKSTSPSPVNELVRAYGPGSKDKLLVKTELKAQSSRIESIPLSVGGEQIVSLKRDKLYSPHNKTKVIAEVSRAGKSEAMLAVEAAKKAAKDWSQLEWEERASVFLKAAELLTEKYRPEMNASTMLGQSKTIHQAEIDAACELIDFFKFNVKYAEMIFEQQPYSPNATWNRLQSRGLEGFVYAVAPFNFSSISVNLAAAPALMGNTVIWKPSHTSALSSWVGMKILKEAGLPDGVISFLPGDAQEISEVLLNHRDFAGLHFTGSTSTFNHLWRSISSNLDVYKTYPRVVGETGGKDFVFVHPSAAVDQVITALVRGSFEYQGQKCSAASRAYIPKSLWPSIKSKLAEITDSLKVGDVEDFKNFMGAVIDERSYLKIKGYIDHAKSDSSCRIIAGGGCDDKVGYFIRPTVIETSNPTYKSMVEEIFGPVLSVFVYEDSRLDECLKVCDESTPYALTGAIFAQDRKVIAYLCNALQNSAGNFYINDKPTGAVVGQQPFGGARKSGTNDKAGSMFNLLRWVSHRTIKENFSPIVDHRYPFMSET